jgi:hypothetical protein
MWDKIDRMTGGRSADGLLEQGAIKAEDCSDLLLRRCRGRPTLHEGRQERREVLVTP